MSEDDVVVICSTRSAEVYSDNQTGPCNECGCTIFWRPHVPEPSIKLCMTCGFAAMNAAEARGDEVEMATNDKQREEIERIHGIGSLEVGHAMLHLMRKLPMRIDEIFEEEDDK